jgi:hypothetical protein
MQSAAVMGSIESARLVPSALRLRLPPARDHGPFGQLGQNLCPVGDGNRCAVRDCLRSQIGPVLIVKDGHQR